MNGKARLRGRDVDAYGVARLIEGAVSRHAQDGFVLRDVRDRATATAIRRASDDDQVGVWNFVAISLQRVERWWCALQQVCVLRQRVETSEAVAVGGILRQLDGVRRPLRQRFFWVFGGSRQQRDMQVGIRYRLAVGGGYR